MQIAESMGDPAELAARARRARREIDAAGLAPDAVESLDVFLREAGLLDAAP
jgi:hypothetical protein